MMLIASQEVAGLRRLIAAALRGGHSAQAIVTLIQRSIDGLYTPRGGFSNQDLDIAFLVKAIGGQRLLYALQKSHGLASETIIQHKLQIPRLLPSIGEPTPDDLIKNLIHSLILTSAHHLPDIQRASLEIFLCSMVWQLKVNADIALTVATLWDFAVNTRGMWTQK